MNEQTWESLKTQAEQAFRDKKFGESESKWLMALEEAEMLGINNPMLLSTLGSLAHFYFQQNKHAYAAPICRRLIAAYQVLLGPEHLDVANMSNNLAMLYHGSRRFDEAELFYRRALAVKTKAYGATHPEVLAIKQSYANMLKLADARRSGRLTASGNWQSMSSDCWKAFSPQDLTEPDSQ